MRIHVLSDLHLEFSPFKPPQTEADVVVLAGDIHVGVKGVTWAKENFGTTPVLYVAGNHEYYGQAFPRLLDKMRAEAQDSTVRVLEKEIFALDGVKFLGCTFWTDFELFGNARIAGWEATQRMTDYRRIRVSPNYRKLRSIDTAVENKKSQRWLRMELDRLDGHVGVVISHHSPTARSLPDRYAEDILDAAYASALDAFVEDAGVPLWIHGHIHFPSDFKIGRTRILCNPRGYPDEPVDDFVDDLVVEV